MEQIALMLKGRPHFSIAAEMPTKLSSDPEHWRSRAEEARVQAEAMDDLVARCAMLDIAAQYERSARSSEPNWGSGRLPLPFRSAQSRRQGVTQIYALLKEGADLDLVIADKDTIQELVKRGDIAATSKIMLSRVDIVLGADHLDNQRCPS
jgi:hypothetical protein